MFFQSKESREFFKQIDTIYKPIKNKSFRVPSMDKHKAAMEELYEFYNLQPIHPNFLMHRKNILDQELNQEGKLATQLVAVAIGILLGIGLEGLREEVGSTIVMAKDLYSKLPESIEHLSIMQISIIILFPIACFFLTTFVYIGTVVFLAIPIISKSFLKKSKNEIKQFEIDLIEEILRIKHKYNPSYSDYIKGVSASIEYIGKSEQNIIVQPSKKTYNRNRLYKYGTITAAIAGLSYICGLQKRIDTDIKIVRETERQKKNRFL